MEKYKWLTIKTEEELKKKYKFKDISKTILEELNLSGVVAIRNFSKLFKLIEAMNEFKNYILKKQNIVYEEEFFISKEHEIAFMLLHYDKQFNKVLGITQLHYLDKNKAKEWRNKYIKMFHTDLGIRFSHQEEIVESINLIYKRMVGEA